MKSVYAFQNLVQSRVWQYYDLIPVDMESYEGRILEQVRISAEPFGDRLIADEGLNIVWNLVFQPEELGPEEHIPSYKWKLLLRNKL
jgi:hypothetical protein